MVFLHTALSSINGFVPPSAPHGNLRRNTKRQGGSRMAGQCLTRALLQKFSAVECSTVHIEHRIAGAARRLPSLREGTRPDVSRVSTWRPREHAAREHRQTPISKKIPTRQSLAKCERGLVGLRTSGPQRAWLACTTLEGQASLQLPLAKNPRLQHEIQRRGQAGHRTCL
jgi:hypothetical protein